MTSQECPSNPSTTNVVAVVGVYDAHHYTTDTIIRLMNGYSCTWPLWIPCGHANSACLGLSHELDADLQAWQRYFDKHYHHRSGWSDADDATRYRQWGIELFQRLCSELPGRAVELNLWPLGGETIRNQRWQPIPMHA